MSDVGRPPAAATDTRVALAIDGASFNRWTSLEIIRDIAEISGGFHLEYVDTGRALQAVRQVMPPPFFRIVRAGMACTITVDGEKVLTGSIDDVDVEWEAGRLVARVRGRDKTGDLVDCAALPEGPAEFRKLDLLAVAKQVCAPFGITVRAEVDIGEPFELLAVNPHETALAFLEKAARQRAVLLVSDGIGGLVLTRGGKTEGPAPLRAPGNIQSVGLRSSWRSRFSDVYVKGQTDAGRRRRGQHAPMDHSFSPLGDDVVYDGDSHGEASTVVMTGHAKDPEITRYRPVVKLTRTQSGMSSTQEQADWWVRIARGMGDQLAYTVLDWRAGPVDRATGRARLWRPNEVVQVVDPWSDIDKPMLIAGVSYAMGSQGTLTRLRVAGVTAFDRINEADKRRRRTAERRPLDATWQPMTAGPKPHG